jgi:hypothetical protein
VLVLSEAYFKSDYCMYELRQIHENKDFRQRVNPIVLSGTPFHKPIDRIPYIKYWEKEIADLQAALNGLGDPKYTLELRKDLDGYAECRRLIVELQSILADMNTLTEEVHVGTDFAALLDRILPQSTVAPPDPFRMQITDEIRNSWPPAAASPTRCRPRCATPGSNRPPTWRPACARSTRSEPSKICSFRRREVRWQCVDPRQPEFADTWSVAKSVLAWLSLLAVDGRVAWSGQPKRAVGWQARFRDRRRDATRRRTGQFPLSTDGSPAARSERHVRKWSERS